MKHLLTVGFRSFEDVGAYNMFVFYRINTFAQF